MNPITTNNVPRKVAIPNITSVSKAVVAKLVTEYVESAVGSAAALARYLECDVRTVYGLRDADKNWGIDYIGAIAIFFGYKNDKEMVNENS